MVGWARLSGVCAAFSMTLLACTQAPEREPQPAALSAPVPTTAPAPEPAKPQPPARPFVIVENASVPIARTRDGCVVLEVLRQWHTLKYRQGAAPQCPTFAAAQPLLREMVQALGAAGLLSDLTSFDVGRQYAAYFERLALAAARSQDWDVRHGKPKHGTPNAFVVATTAQADAFFPEVARLFAGSGLRPELRSVEKVLVLPASQTPFAAQLSAAGVDDDAKLPHDCILIFHLAGTTAAP